MSDNRQGVAEGPRRQVSGWPGLFRTAFKRSQNAMVLVDAARRQIEVNSAYSRLLKRGRRDLIGHHLYEFVKGGPLVSEEDWRRMLLRDESAGRATMLRSDGESVVVEWAAHPELVTGQRLVLFVAMRTSLWGRHFRREVDEEGGNGELSEREREIVHLVALGQSGPEIAEQLHISHNTVRTHLRNAMIKTGARSRAHLVAKSLGNGQVPAR
jgi:PAS domain S-box-containing protein